MQPASSSRPCLGVQPVCARPGEPQSAARALAISSRFLLTLLPGCPVPGLQAAVLLAGDVQRNTALMLEAFTALEQREANIQVQPALPPPASRSFLPMRSHPTVPVRLPGAPFCLQAHPAQLNAAHSGLLERLFFQAPSSASTVPPDEDAATFELPGGQGMGQQSGPDLALCSRVVAGWERQMAACKDKPRPVTARASEALAVTRILGRQEYTGA